MAATDAADDQLDLKKRARRRLVGAAALALLAVIVLPVVMDREPKPATQDILVRIPSQDGAELAAKPAPAKRTVAAENDDVAVAAPADAAAVAAAAIAAKTAVDSKSQAAVADTPAAKPESQQEAKLAEAKSQAKPDAKSATTKADSKPETKAADRSAKDKADKPADRSADKATAAKKVEEARAVAVLEGRSSDGKSGGGQWVVQIGAYQNAGNVKLIVAKMKEVGVASYTEKLDTPQGPRIRVRAGPFPSRDAAEKAQTKLKIIGVSGPVAQKQ
ncbi:MAG TPA: SPOR domain-containing protein [Rhodocyclaceae bacterium]|nr:SPOR domain-containing protein [Rhodocyclaceae bacterium]